MQQHQDRADGHGAVEPTHRYWQSGHRRNRPEDKENSPNYDDEQKQNRKRPNDDLGDQAARSRQSIFDEFDRKVTARGNGHCRAYKRDPDKQPDSELLGPWQGIVEDIAA